jgi:hypothetical protein
MGTFGHNQPITFSPQRTFERRLRSETCRMIYFSTSAISHSRQLPCERRKYDHQRLLDRWFVAKTVFV